MDIVIILVTSSVSTIRVWAIYQRNTKVLVFLVLAFVACYVPPIAIVSGAKVLKYDSGATRDAELSESVNTFISTVSNVDPALVPWQLERCFVPSLPMKYVGVIIGTLVYESKYSDGDRRCSPAESWERLRYYSDSHDLPNGS